MKPEPGRWLIAGTRTHDLYPCRCSRTRRCNPRCPCHGRRDTDHLPRYCCTRTQEPQ